MRYGRVPELDSFDISQAAWGAWSALATYCQWEKVGRRLVRSRPGTCFPSIGKLCKTAHVSERTLQKALQELEAARLLEVQRTEGGVNQYILYPWGNAPLSAAAQAREREEEERTKEDVLREMREFRERLEREIAAEQAVGVV